MATITCHACGKKRDPAKQAECPTCAHAHTPAAAASSSPAPASEPEPGATRTAREVMAERNTVDESTLSLLRSIRAESEKQTEKLTRIHFWVKWIGAAWVVGLAGGLVVVVIAATSS